MGLLHVQAIKIWFLFWLQIITSLYFNNSQKLSKYPAVKNVVTRLCNQIIITVSVCNMFCFTFPQTSVCNVLCFIFPQTNILVKRYAKILSSLTVFFDLPIAFS